MSRDRLTEYMQGAGETDGLRVRLIKLLEELAEERKQHRKRAEQHQDAHQALKARPQDEATRRRSTSSIASGRRRWSSRRRSISASCSTRLTDAG